MQSNIGSALLRKVGLVIALILLIATLLACNTDSGEDAVNTATTSAQLQEIASFTGLRFPDGITLIRYEREMESDALIRAKFIFTPSQWHSFLNQLPFEPNAFDNEQRYLLGANFDWWNPQDASQLPTAQAHLPDAQVLDVGVDHSDPQHLVVFLVWHRT